MKKNSKSMICVIAVIFTLLTGCQNDNGEIEALKQENEQLRQQIAEFSKEESNTSIKNFDESEFKVDFEDNGSPMIFGNSEHIAEIKGASIVYSPRLNKHLLKIDFHYTNKNNKSANFINNLYCNVIAYQDGIELDTPGITSEENVYDTNSAYKNIKNAEIDTQLAFVLNNTESALELELGSEYYSSLVTKKIVISVK